MSTIRNLFSGLRASSSGTTAERARIDVITRNIANAQTTRMPGHDTPTPYQRQQVSFEPILRRLANGQDVVEGVRVSSIEPDTATAFEEIYDPGHPDADARGVVRMPNVNATREMADLITAVRAYEANIKAQENFIRMAESALRLAQ